MRTRSTKHFWWIWIGIEIVFVSLLFIAMPAVAWWGDREVLVSEINTKGGIGYYLDETKPFSGQAVSYNEKGYIVERFTIQDGKLNGLYEAYFWNGKLKIKGNYLNSKTHGLVQYFSEDGELLSEDCYQNHEQVELDFCKNGGSISAEGELVGSTLDRSENQADPSNLAITGKNKKTQDTEPQDDLSTAKAVVVDEEKKRRQQERAKALENLEKLQKLEQLKRVLEDVEKSRTLAKKTEEKEKKISKNTITPLSSTDIDKLRQHLTKCWEPSAAVAGDSNMIVDLVLSLDQDGHILGAEVENKTRLLSDDTFKIAANEAIKATRECSPLPLPPEKYEQWKNLTVSFDPRFLSR
jgi:hypothetical protein